MSIVLRPVENADCGVSVWPKTLNYGGRSMKTFLRLTMVFTIILLACNVWALGPPQCPLDPNYPDWDQPTMPDNPGACFFSNTGVESQFFIYDGTRLVWVFSPQTDAHANDFFRFNSKGKGFWHELAKDSAVAALCTDMTLCDYSDEVWFVGSVTLTLIGASPNGVYGEATCPWTVRVHGELENFVFPEDHVKLHALGTMVKDPNLGCREPLIKIDVDPINK